MAGFAVSSRQGLLGEWRVHNSAQQAVFTGVRVEQGEVIDFVCDCVGTGEADEFVWIPRIEYSGFRSEKDAAKTKLVWGAKADFNQTFPPIPRRMSRWEQYVQVLLQANELHFMD